MKIELTEYDGHFVLDMEAETVKDAALLARFHKNRSRVPTDSHAAATQTGEFFGGITFGKLKHSNGQIERK